MFGDTCSPHATWFWNHTLSFRLLDQPLDPFHSPSWNLSSVTHTSISFLPAPRSSRGYTVQMTSNNHHCGMRLKPCSVSAAVRSFHTADRWTSNVSSEIQLPTANHTAHGCQWTHSAHLLLPCFLVHNKNIRILRNDARMPARVSWVEKQKEKIH